MSDPDTIDTNSIDGSPWHLYYEVWRTVGQTFFDYDRLANWRRWEKRFVNEMRTIDDAIKCANKMLSSLNDDHTWLLDPQAVEEDKAAARDSYVGIGVITTSKKHGWLIDEIKPDGPAAQAGLQAGDLIVEINGRPIKDMSKDEIAGQLNSKRGTPVVILARRSGVAFSCSLVLTKIKMPDVRAEIDGGIGYLQIASFGQKSTLRQVRHALEHELRDAQALIIDLRGNPGGWAHLAVGCASLFIKQGHLVTMEKRVPNTKIYSVHEYHVDKNGLTKHSRKGKSYRKRVKPRQPCLVKSSTPIVILVDKETASAGEMFAGALKDNGRALVIGTRTFGKGIGQANYFMPYGAELCVTHMRYYTPSGIWPGDAQKIRPGIEPDLYVKGKERLAQSGVERDAQLQAALRHLMPLVAADKGSMNTRVHIPLQPPVSSKKQEGKANLAHPKQVKGITMNLVNDHSGCELLQGPAPDRQEYGKRVEEFWNKMAPDSVAILVAYPERTRSRDTEHTYRASSDMLYLNGFPEPEAALVISKLAEQPQHRSVMFVRPKDPAQEVWTGIRQGVVGAKKNYDADEAYTVDKFRKVVSGLIGKADHVYYRFGVNAEYDKQFNQIWQPAQKPLLNPETIVHEMRLFKSANELALIEHACQISAEAHRYAMLNTAPGMTEGQLQSIMEYSFGLHGAREVAYGSIVADGNHGCVLHYTENSGNLHSGDLVLVDAGAEYHGYASDITRTWPVSGKFTRVQSNIYQIVLDAQMAAIEMTAPGVPLRHIHLTAARVMRHGLKRLGILPPTSNARTDRKIMNAKARATASGASVRAGDYPLTLWDLFMHGTSHWMGLDVHDVGSYENLGANPNNNRNKASKQRLLEPGMVFTVEPGLYLPKDDRRIPTRYRGIGIRIEDDVVVTESGYKVLSADVPKAIDEIETLMAGA